MIKKLRFKFILYSSLSIFLLLALILVSVNVINYSKVADSANKVTLAIAENNGTIPNRGEFPVNPGENPPEEPSFSPDERFDDRKEMVFDLRFFTVTINKDGVVTNVNTDRIASIDENTAKELALSLYKKNAKTGWNKFFRYRVYEKDSETTVILVDYERELTPSKTVLITSSIVGTVGVLISIVIIYFISNLVVKPVDDAFKKQKHFISNASHELKTPLTIISANNEILEIEHGKNESTDTINRQVRKLNSMIKELNNLSKVDELNRINEFYKWIYNFCAYFR